MQVVNLLKPPVANYMKTLKHRPDKYYSETTDLAAKTTPRRIKVLTYLLVNWIITHSPLIKKNFLRFNPRKDIFMKTHSTRFNLPLLRITACFVMLLTVSDLAAAPEPDTASTELNSSVKTNIDSIAVTVNGVNIKESQIQTELEPQIQKMAAQLPPAFVEQYKKQLRQQVLEKMIVEQLLDEKVKAAKIVITDEEAIEQIKEMASQQQPPLSMEDFKALIEAYGQSFDDVKNRIRKGLAYQKLMEAQWAGKLNIKDEDVKKYYVENKSQFETPELVRASHILITPKTNDPNTDPNQAKAAALAKAQDLLKQIKDGADFAELAKANSDCPSSQQGGDLNFFGKNQMVPAFEKAAFELKPGQVSDTVETKFGYHIIKVTDHKNPNVATFEQAKDDIIKLLTQTKKAEYAEEYVNSLKADAKIVYPPGKEPQAPTPPVMKAVPRPDNKPVTEPEKKTPN